MAHSNDTDEPSVSGDYPTHKHSTSSVKLITGSSNTHCQAKLDLAAAKNALLNKQRKRKQFQQQPDTFSKQSGHLSDPDIIVLDSDSEKGNIESSEELRRLATEALISESKRSAQRAEAHGPQGWLKPKSLSTNKVFITNTLKSVAIANMELAQRNARHSSHSKSKHDRHKRDKRNDTKRLKEER